MKEINGKYATAKVFTDNAEKEALEQVKEMVNHELTKGTQVRLMPDIHKGKGSTIGTTIKLPEDFSEWKVSPNIVGIDVGCFTGTTEVMLADGRSLSFVELIEENNKGIENYIYGIDSNGEVGIEKLYAPRKIDTVKELAYITLDNGETIECTTDHKFILRDGRSKEAKSLNVNDSLMPLYMEKAKNVKNELRDYKLSKLTKSMGEYHAVYMPGKMTI